MIFRRARFGIRLFRSKFRGSCGLFFMAESSRWMFCKQRGSISLTDVLFAAVRGNG
ncbi:hypothetical protein LINPERHAP1_LOCUS30677 [Linum perenne]